MGEKINIKEEYQKYTKYNLPEYEALNKEFELYFIEKSEFLLCNIRRRIHEKLAFFARILEGIIYPNPSSLVNMQEAKFFSDEEKGQITALYKKIVLLERNSNKLDVKSDEKENAEFINLLFKEWPFLTNQMFDILQKIENSWKKEEKSSGESYFG